MDDIVSNSSVTENTYLQALVSMYNNEMKSMSAIQDSIDLVYEREIKLLLDRKSKGELPASTRETIVEEFCSLSNLTNFGIRTGEKQSDDVISVETISNIHRDFKTECPVLADIVASLFPESANSNRKSNCAVHALSLLTSVRNQNFLCYLQSCLFLMELGVE